MNMRELERAIIQNDHAPMDTPVRFITKDGDIHSFVDMSYDKENNVVWIIE
jgi:hypothetical protein